MKVLNFGSLNIDYVYSVDHIVTKGETQSSFSRNVFSGGKGLNQSIALARADVAVYQAGMIGQDGLFLLDILKKEGVNVDFVQICDGASGHAIIQNSLDGENSILLYGGANQQMTKEYVDYVLSHFEIGDFLILQNEINELAYMIQKAHERGMVICLNPSPMNDIILQLPLELIDWWFFNEVEAS